MMTLDYQLFDHSEQVATVRRELHNLEQQHYVQVLSGLAQAANKNAVAAADEAKAKLAAGVQALRDELARLESSAPAEQQDRADPPAAAPAPPSLPVA